MSTDPEGPAPADLTGAIEDASVIGDRAVRPSTARDALRYRSFRIMWLGGLASNVGSWMQNFVLAAVAYELTHSAAFVGVVTFAQAGPLLLVTPIGGILADSVDRRRLLIAALLSQTALSICLAGLAWGGNPPRLPMIVIVAGIGVGQALVAPTWSAAIPTLVEPRALGAAISLNAAQIQGARIVGPAIGGLLYAAAGPGPVFFVNGLSYLAVAWAAALVPLGGARQGDARPANRTVGAQLTAGLRTAHADVLVHGCLLTIFVFSLASLVVVGQFPVVATDIYGVDVKSTTYALFYACFAIGTFSGSLALGTIGSGWPRPTAVSFGLLGYAVTLACFATCGVEQLGFAIALCVGFFYFVFATSLNSVLQEHLDDAVRGRVMALWIMAFGGTMPLGNLLAGPLVDATSIRAVLLLGALVAGGLGWCWRGSTNVATAARIRSV